jgi:hypothetical protein
VQTVFGEQHVREQHWAGTAARDRMRWRRWLAVV